MIKDPWIIVSGSEDAAERAARKLKKTDKTKLCSRYYIGHWHERVGPNAA
jgi:hypothetical protein